MRRAAAAALVALASAAGGTAAARAEDRAFVLDVDAVGANAPARFVVRAGDAVAIEFRGGAPGEAHLHGYDLVAVLPAAGVAWRFVARATGLYPIHVHRAGAARQRHGLPAAYLEVRPR